MKAGRKPVGVHAGLRATALAIMSSVLKITVCQGVT